MDARMVRVKIELDLIEGQHFIAPKNNSKESLIGESKKAFISWLDSWYEKNHALAELEDYVQAFIVEN